MKRFFAIFCLMSLLLSACSSRSAQTPLPPQTSQKQPAQTTVQLPVSEAESAAETERIALTPELELAARRALRKPDATSYYHGILTRELLAKITELNVVGAAAKTGGVFADGTRFDQTALEGLEHFTGLRTLYLHDYSGGTLDFLSKAPNLETLALTAYGPGGDPIMSVDVAAAAEHETLKTLAVRSYRIRDKAALGTLTGLESLGLYRCAITDLTPLGSLTDLQSLTIYSGEAGKEDGFAVTDLAPLKNLTSLEYLYLSGFEGSLAPITELSLHSLALVNCKVNSFRDLPSAVEHLMLKKTNFVDADFAYLPKTLKHVQLYQPVDDWSLAENTSAAYLYFPGDVDRFDICESCETLFWPENQVWG